MRGSQRWTGWVDMVCPTQWAAYQRVLEKTLSLRIPFALGGGFATATHTGCSRDTGDMDLYVLPRDLELMVKTLGELGFNDIYEQYPYDRSWTYRATDGKAIVEVIWRMRNHRAYVDPTWLERATE